MLSTPLLLMAEKTRYIPGTPMHERQRKDDEEKEQEPDAVNQCAAFKLNPIDNCQPFIQQRDRSVIVIGDATEAR